MDASSDLDKPSSSHQANYYTDASSDFNKLVSIFPNVEAHQIKILHEVSHQNFSTTVDCLLEGPTTTSVLHLITECNGSHPTTKVPIDQTEVWHDMVTFYKSH